MLHTLFSEMKWKGKTISRSTHQNRSNRTTSAGHPQWHESLVTRETKLPVFLWLGTIVVRQGLFRGWGRWTRVDLGTKVKPDGKLVSEHLTVLSFSHEAISIVLFRVMFSKTYWNGWSSFHVFCFRSEHFHDINGWLHAWNKNDAKLVHRLWRRTKKNERYSQLRL